MYSLASDFYERFGLTNTVFFMLCCLFFWLSLFLFVARKDAPLRRTVLYIVLYGFITSICLVEFLRENHDLLDLTPGNVPLGLSPLTFITRIALFGVLILSLLHLFCLLKFPSRGKSMARGWHFFHFFVVVAAPLQFHTKSMIDIISTSGLR